MKRDDSKKDEPPKRRRIVARGRLPALDDPSTTKPSLSQSGYVVFMRGLALFGLAVGTGYWLRLIGWEVGPNWRFDQMSLSWRAAATTLAVLYPFAASGLWMLASWGIVVWFICGAIEITMYGVFAGTFGSQPLLVLLHVLIALLYFVWRVHLHLQIRRRNAALRVNVE